MVPVHLRENLLHLVQYPILLGILIGAVFNFVFNYWRICSCYVWSSSIQLYRFRYALLPSSVIEDEAKVNDPFIDHTV